MALGRNEQIRSKCSITPESMNALQCRDEKPLRSRFPTLLLTALKFPTLTLWWVKISDTFFESKFPTLSFSCQQRRPRPPTGYNLGHHANPGLHTFWALPGPICSETDRTGAHRRCTGDRVGGIARKGLHDCGGDGSLGCDGSSVLWQETSPVHAGCSLAGTVPDPRRVAEIGCSVRRERADDGGVQLGVQAFRVRCSRRWKWMRIADVVELEGRHRHPLTSSSQVVIGRILRARPTTTTLLFVSTLRRPRTDIPVRAAGDVERTNPRRCQCTRLGSCTLQATRVVCVMDSDVP
ncbi:hypothetical protein B0H11DRAFT_1908181 [Mycena galericulata]|nr:hypothetical protein B0H11DRAFT_1908181 [Mycena galericulata]